MTQTAGPAADTMRDAADLLRNAQSIAILSHVGPDADAIGSIVGLSSALRAMGKDVVPALSDPVPTYARFLKGADDIASFLPARPFDTYVFADAADIDRVGDLYTADPGRFQGASILDLDHHRTNPLYGTVNVVDGAASSTSELSYRLLRELEAPVDADTATALLFGVVGDTGSFRNGATTPGSLEVASELVSAGADFETIAFQLFERKRFRAARLWGEVLSQLELLEDRRMVVAWLSQAMLRASGATMDETEGIVAYLRGIEEADVAILLKEAEDGAVKVSMRSRPHIDVSAIAFALGGGGHRQAAGCTVPGPREQALQTLIDTYDRFYRT